MLVELNVQWCTIAMGATLYQSLLMVTDLEASIEFYRDIVGLEPDVVEEGNVEFATGQCTLVLESDFDRDTLDAFGLNDPGWDRGDGVIVAISVDDVNEVYKRDRRGRHRQNGPDRRELGSTDDVASRSGWLYRRDICLVVVFELRREIGRSRDRLYS